MANNEAFDSNLNSLNGVELWCGVGILCEDDKKSINASRRMLVNGIDYDKGIPPRISDSD
jgi:hypothetical protein